MTVCRACGRDPCTSPYFCAQGESEAPPLQPEDCVITKRPAPRKNGNGSGLVRSSAVSIEKLQARMGFPDLSGSGQIRKTCANARYAIGRMQIKCEYDAFHDRLVIGGHVINEYAGELSDYACLVLRRMIEEQYEFDPGKEKMFDAAIQLCLENRFDPVVTYLDNLGWDGTDRLDEWLATYLGAEKTKLNSAIGKIALIAQVRRAKRPGIKFDQIIVLEGIEGILKSTFLRMLAGSDDNFSDQTILGRKDKEQQELLRGKWVYEIADLSNIRRAEVEDVKAFASRTHDRARPAYGRAVVEIPRRCVIWATTNNAEYLKSQTGNRRFWPIQVKNIDLESFARDRDQLLAEAAWCESQGASIVLPQELWASAGEEQEQRRQADPWEDILRDERGQLEENEHRVLTKDLLEAKLGIPAERQTALQCQRIGECMRRLGWQGPKQMRIGGRDGRSGRGFWRPLL